MFCSRESLGMLDHGPGSGVVTMGKHEIDGERMSSGPWKGRKALLRG